MYKFNQTSSNSDTRIRRVYYVKINHEIRLRGHYKYYILFVLCCNMFRTVYTAVIRLTYKRIKVLYFRQTSNLQRVNVELSNLDIILKKVEYHGL